MTVDLWPPYYNIEQNSLVNDLDVDIIILIKISLKYDLVICNTTLI